MNQQPSLFDQPEAPYVRNSVTSQQAAERIAPTAGTLRAAVLAYLRAHPEGATDEAMQIGIPMAQNTQRPRRGELQARGLVRDSGRQGKTAAGRNAVIWEATR